MQTKNNSHSKVHDSLPLGKPTHNNVGIVRVHCSRISRERYIALSIISFPSLPVLGVYVENLSEYFVKCPEEIGRLLKSGKKKLAIAETKMNRQSSRQVTSIL